MKWKSSLSAAISVGMLSSIASAWAAPIRGPQTVPIIMLSDIHFDPFYDPAKFAQLRSGDVSRWESILTAPDSPHQANDFASLQQTCEAPAADTDWSLFASSMRAAKSRQPTPLFVTVSGDLMVHQFGCRFRTLAPGGSSSALSAFAAKTVAFVALELREAFPHVPIYLALGNNDSGCGDFQETPGSAFLRSVAQSVAVDAGAPNEATVLREFPEEGNYDVELPKPMNRTRMIVLQNIFQSSTYKTCAGATDLVPSKTQIAWLEAHLADAHARGERVWVMAHIPPGVNVHSTFLRNDAVCSAQSPKMFLNSEALPDTLTKYGDTVRLVIFGHTHNDEIRLLKPSGCNQGRDRCAAIPAKLVPSITPLHGNNPAFLVAQVSPSTSTIIDYSVFAANNEADIGSKWEQEYRYSEAYGLPDLSAASVERLVAGFALDKSGVDALSRAYERWYSPGDSNGRDTTLQRTWPAYVCSLTLNEEAAFRECACSGRVAVAP